MRNHKNIKTVPPEFSHLFDTQRLSPGGAEIHVKMEASSVEREALAKRLGLLGINALTALVRVRRMKGKNARLRVLGNLHADVVQSCVVSLNPVPEVVDEDFTIVFTDEPMEEAAGISVDDDREPLDFVDGKLDLGEMVAQQLSLTLNPYPRDEDAVINAEDAFLCLQTE